MSSPRRKRSESDIAVERETPSNADSSSGEQDQAGVADEERIRARAYELYLERGGGSSDEMEDWLRAEREYRGRERQRDSADGDAPENFPAA